VRGWRQLGGRLAGLSLFGLELPFLLLWFVLATILATIAGRVADWNDMTDELVWERLAISIWQYHSLLPRLHGEVIRNLAQLYPALISPIFAGGRVPSDLENAHILDAWVMSSAAIPAFLLARRVTGKRWPAYLLAVVSVAMPWIVYSTVLATEVLAYPLFLWALLAIHRSITSPRWSNDLVALVAIVLAFFARTQFALLAGVYPLAVVAAALGAPGEGSWRRRSVAALAGSVRAHITLVCFYVPLLAAVVVYRLAGGGLSHLSLYSSESSPSIASTATAGSVTGHAADLAFGMGILPFVVGSAWLFAGVVRPSPDARTRAFASVGSAALVVTLVVVSAWDLTIGSFVIDRYLFYLVPVIVLAFVCALLDAHRPQWSLIVPAVVVAIGFATHLQADFLWSGKFPLSTDSPIATLYKPLAELGGGKSGAAAILAVGTLVLAGLFVLLAQTVRHDLLTLVFALLLLVAFPVDTAYTFHTLFSKPGHSGRPLTRSESGVLDWVDRAVGTGARVTEIPYATNSSFFITQQSWRDLEFWNKSIRYAAHYPTPDVYDDAVVWFPNTPLAFNPRTGYASHSPTPYVVQSVTETRFRIAGNVQVQGQTMMLIDADQPWRTSWLTYGLYDDGWTKPNRTVRARVFSFPGQKRAYTKTLSFQLQAPPDVDRRTFAIASNLTSVRGVATNTDTTFENINVCVPAHGYTEVSLKAAGASSIPGDQRSLAYSNLTDRRGGVLVADLSLADEVGKPCSPGGSSSSGLITRNPKP
jgi:hypothetical protein